MKISLAALLLVLAFINLSAFGEERQSFREKMREKVKARMVRREAQRPATKTETETEIEINFEKPGDYTLSFIHDGLTRLYKIHIPSSYDVSVATPLLIALHGGGGDMNYQAEDKYYKQISKSDKEGYIVAFPNGYSRFNSGKFATWNAGHCCGEARNKKIDDVGFIRELIKRISSKLNIDKTKIFATGISNGAMMAYRLACELPQTFKAIATVAGTDNTINCDPSNPVSILHIHARNDDHVLFNGGSGASLAKNKAQVTEFVSVPETISKWLKINECNEKPKKILEVSGAYCELYSSCKNKTEVELCVTESGGHSWPGGEKPRGSAETSKAISANDVIWDFFKSK